MEKELKVQNLSDQGINADRITRLEHLVAELLKDINDEELIEIKMMELEMQYTADPVERINRVLEQLHPYQILEDTDF